MCGHIDGDMLVDVTSRFRCTLLGDETTETAQENIIFFSQLLFDGVHEALYYQTDGTLVIPRRDRQFINETSFCHMFFYYFS